MKICGKTASLLQIWVVPKKHQKTIFFLTYLFVFDNTWKKKFNEYHCVEFLRVHLLMQYAMRSGLWFLFLIRSINLLWQPFPFRK